MADREVVVRLRADIASYKRDLADAAVTTDRFGRSIDGSSDGLERAEKQASQTGNEIDKLSGRLRIAADAALILGPALVPLGGAAIGAAAALTAQVGALGAALGVTLLATHGLADGLKALDAYQLDKTPENLAKVRQEFDKLGPAGEEFVLYLDSIEGDLSKLQNTARAGMFPGFEEGIDSLLTLLPQVRSLIRGYSTEVGDLAADTGAAVANGQLEDFLDYLQHDGVRILDDTARTIGNLGTAGANLLAAFAPIQTDFSGGLLDLSQNLEHASENLDSSHGFQNLLDYIESEGPQALDTLEAIANAAVQIVQDAAPLGGPVLKAIEGVANALSTVADSDLGTPIFASLAALSGYNRALQITSSLNQTSWGSKATSNLRGFASAIMTTYSAQDRARMTATEFVAAEEKRTKAIGDGLKTMGKGAAVAGALAVATSGVADHIGLTNTASLALAGTIAGPWGAALGAGAGLLLDWRAHSDEAKQSAQDFTGTLDAQTGALTANSSAMAAKKLNDAGALDAAKSLGLSLQLVTEAALGNQDAIAQVNTALSKYDTTSVAFTTGRGAGPTGALSDQANAALKVRDAIGDISGAVAASQADFNTQASAIGNTTTQTNLLRQAYDATADAAAGLATEMESLDGFLSKRGSFRAYQADLDALRDSLKKTPNDWSAFTEAGRTNLGNLDQIVADASKHLQDLTDPKAKVSFLNDVMDQLRSIGKTSPAAAAAVRKVMPALQEVQAANKAVVIKANNADAMKKAAETHAAMVELNTMRPRPVITADAGSAIHTAQTLKAVLDSLHSKSLTVALHYQTIGNKPSVPLPGQSADGSTVPKTGLPYADRHPYLLADGEEVISNRYGQADRHRGLLKAINANMLADGGTAGTGKPLFTGEGPRFYRKAYKHNRPFAIDGPDQWDYPYQTSLTDAAMARAFEKWVADNNVPFDVGARLVDYDMRGYWKKTRGRGWKQGSHFPDTFKTPYDTTFSHESKYATADNPFYWHGDKLIDQRDGSVVFAADGGLITGPGGPRDDRIPAMVSNREYVMPAAAVDYYGVDFMDAIRGQHLADGGQVNGGTPKSSRSKGTPGLSTFAAFLPVNTLSLLESVVRSELTGPDPKTVKGARGELKELEHTAKSFGNALKKSKDAVDKERQSRDDLVSQANEFGSTVGSAYSKADPFAGGLSDFDTAVSANTNDTDAANAALAAAARKGLDGALYSALASSGNLTLLQEFGNLSAAQIQQRELQYAGQSNSQSALGSTAESHQFAAAIADHNKTLKSLQADQRRANQTNRALQQEINHLKNVAEKLGKHVEDGARKGVSEKQSRRQAQTQTRGR